jgi:hypothetical protein
MNAIPGAARNPRTSCVVRAMTHALCNSRTWTAAKCAGRRGARDGALASLVCSAVHTEAQLTKEPECTTFRRGPRRRLILISEETLWGSCPSPYGGSPYNASESRAKGIQ